MKRLYLKPRVESEEVLEQTSLACYFTPDFQAFTDAGCTGAKYKQMYLAPPICSDGFWVLGSINCDIDVDGAVTIS